jgi:hypothetical protein
MADECMIEAVAAGLERFHNRRENAAFQREGAQFNPPRFRKVSKVTAITRTDAFGAGRSLVVVRGGDPQITLTFECAGRRVELPAFQGAHYRFPFDSCKVTIPQPVTGIPTSSAEEIVLAAASDERAFEIPFTDWNPLNIGENIPVGELAKDLSLPNDNEYDIHGIGVRIVCDANAGNRVIVLTITDPGTSGVATVAKLATQTNITANSDYTAMFGPFGSDGGAGAGGNNGREAIPMPRLFMFPTSAVFNVDVTNVQAGDTITAWITGRYRGRLIADA